MMRRIVVMGVSGCGKSTIAEAIAKHLSGTYIDADSLHPAANVAKMAAGEPLTDADRLPWLEKVGIALSGGTETCVVACSALRRMYRNQIARIAGGDVMFIYLHGTREVLLKRMEARKGHYMPASLLDSQLATLEPPETDEIGVTLDIDQTEEAVVSAVLQAVLERETRN